MRSPKQGMSLIVAPIFRGSHDACGRHLSTVSPVVCGRAASAWQDGGLSRVPNGHDVPHPAAAQAPGGSEPGEPQRVLQRTPVPRPQRRKSSHGWYQRAYLVWAGVALSVLLGSCVAMMVISAVLQRPFHTAARPLCESARGAPRVPHHADPPGADGGTGSDPARQVVCYRTLPVARRAAGRLRHAAASRRASASGDDLDLRRLQQQHLRDGLASQRSGTTTNRPAHSAKQVW
jgi:hypothetical protein